MDRHRRYLGRYAEYKSQWGKVNGPKRRAERQSLLNARAEPHESVGELIRNKGTDPELIEHRQGTEVITEFVRLVEEDEQGFQSGAIDLFGLAKRTEGLRAAAARVEHLARDVVALPLDHPARATFARDARAAMSWARERLAGSIYNGVWPDKESKKERWFASLPDGYGPGSEGKPFSKAFPTELEAVQAHDESARRAGKLHLVNLPTPEERAALAAAPRRTDNWTDDEHADFLELMQRYGRNEKEIAAAMKTRDERSVRRQFERHSRRVKEHGAVFAALGPTDRRTLFKKRRASARDDGADPTRARDDGGGGLEHEYGPAKKACEIRRPGEAAWRFYDTQTAAVADSPGLGMSVLSIMLSSGHRPSGGAAGYEARRPGDDGGGGVEHAEAPPRKKAATAKAAAAKPATAKLVDSVGRGAEPFVGGGPPRDGGGGAEHAEAPPKKRAKTKAATAKCTEAKLVDFIDDDVVYDGDACSECEASVSSDSDSDDDDDEPLLEDLDVDDEDDPAWSVGDRVLARYQGGRDRYRGAVAGVHGDGTYDIVYDDDQIRERLSAYFLEVDDEADDDAVVLADEAVGRRVEIFWAGDDAWYAGTVVGLADDGRHHVHYDDGDEGFEDLAAERFRVVDACDADDDAYDDAYDDAPAAADADAAAPAAAAAEADALRAAAAAADALAAPAAEALRQACEVVQLAKAARAKARATPSAALVAEAESLELKAYGMIVVYERISGVYFARPAEPPSVARPAALRPRDRVVTVPPGTKPYTVLLVNIGCHGRYRIGVPEGAGPVLDIGANFEYAVRHDPATCSFVAGVDTAAGAAVRFATRDGVYEVRYPDAIPKGSLATVFKADCVRVPAA